MNVIKSEKSTMDKIEELLVTGNLNQFSKEERVTYINKICELTGLNPLTRPFDFITFQGKLTLYATKSCTDQLRKIHKVSIKVASQKIESDIFFVTVEAVDKDGRVDSDVGAISIANLKGDSLANAIMKAITKSKRRVTLSICGLGLLDESEVDSLVYSYDESSPLHGLSQERLKEIDNRLHEKTMKEPLLDKDAEEITKQIIEIKGFLTVLTAGQEPQEKGAFMYNNLGIRSFKELDSWSLESLKEKAEFLNSLNEKKKKEELKKKQNEKPSFVLEGQAE